LDAWAPRWLLPLVSTCDYLRLAWEFIFPMIELGVRAAEILGMLLKNPKKSFYPVIILPFIK
jgi:hypothetical protein